MKKFVFLVLLQITSYCFVQGQLASFNFNTSPYISPSANNSNLSVSNLQLSSGTISTNIATGTYFSDEPYVEATGGWAEGSELTAKYFFIELTSQPGYRFAIANVSYQIYATASGPSATSILINNTPIATHNVASAALQTLSQAVTGFDKCTHAILKIAAWNNGSRATTGAGTLRIDNIVIDGTVELIPPNNSNSVLKPGLLPVPQKLSSVATDAYIPVMQVVFADSASGDGVSTFVDSLLIKAGINNQLTPWSEKIAGAKWVYNAYGDTVSGVVGNNSIHFKTTGFEIREGLIEPDTCTLLIKLKPNLSDDDGRRFQFLIDSSLVFCNAAGSKIGRGLVETGIDELKVDVLATQIKVKVEPNIIFKDSLFQILVEAADTHGNIDKDENGIVQVLLEKGDGALQTSTSLSKNFLQGKVLFNGLKFMGSDTLTINLKTDKFTDFLVADKLVGKPLFYDDFESVSLTKWYNTADWSISSSEAVNGLYSVKHNVLGVSDTSYLSSQFNAFPIDNGKTVWRMLVKNGNFDPTSTNRFWYFLMASQANLLSSETYGYAVGVNVLGSSDTLSIWKIDEYGNKTVVLKTNFDWGENDTVAIEVIRNVSGIWQIGYKQGNDFTNLTYSVQATDNAFNNLPYHGMVFQYSSTRAGLLWFDDISVIQLNTPPKIAKVSVLSADTLSLSFTEPLLQTEATDINNYHMGSATDMQVKIQQVLFDTNYPDRVTIVVNRLKTAQYSIHVAQLTDLEGCQTAVDSISFSYQVTALKHDVVISEIMFDPTPKVGLPEADYIEIYNRGENPFNLSGWKLDVGGLVKTFPDTVIQIGEYLILSSTSHSLQFAEFGKVIGLISTTDLSNSGKPLRLISNKNVLIDSVYYKPYWNTVEQKQDGGWALERIDLNNFCAEVYTTS